MKFPRFEAGFPGLSPSSAKLHVQLYEGAIASLVRLEVDLERLAGDASAYSPRAEARRRETALLNAITLHENFFRLVGEATPPGATLALEVERWFGTLGKMVVQLREAAAGAGAWTVLGRERRTGALRIVTADQDATMPVDFEVLLALDVAEHAYWSDYGPVREAWIEAMLEAVDWTAIDGAAAPTGHVVPVPAIRQSSPWACGPACVASALGALGRDARVAEIAEDAGTTPEIGTSPEGLARALIAVGAPAYVGAALKHRELVAMLHLGQLVIVSVLLWGGPHWVLAHGIRDGRIVVMDPALGADHELPPDVLDALRFRGDGPRPAVVLSTPPAPA